MKDDTRNVVAFQAEIASALKSCVYDFVRTTVAALDLGSRLLNEARSVLRGSGVVSGAFGFAKLHAERKALLEPWLADPSETVRTFAAEQIRELDRWIAAETQSAEASIAQRKLDYGEELDAGDARRVASRTAASFLPKALRAMMAGKCLARGRALPASQL